LTTFQLEHDAIEGNLREVPVSTLAWIGDSVFDLYVRMALASRMSHHNSGDLHRSAIKMVSAPAQAAAMQTLLPFLSQEETSIAKRARNHDPGSLPRNADPILYRKATALEALIGYHYLARNYNRLTELMKIIIRTYFEKFQVIDN